MPVANTIALIDAEKLYRSLAKNDGDKQIAFDLVCDERKLDRCEFANWLEGSAVKRAFVAKTAVELTPVA